MARYEVAPTKTNLLRFKTDYSFAREGHELLEQKKDILTTELLALVDSARVAQERMDRLLANAHNTLKRAVLRMGKKGVAETALAAKVESRVSVSTRRVMGVMLPRVEISVLDRPANSSPGETSFWVDEAAAKFTDALRELGTLVETSVSLKLLAAEVKKTMRRVNALEKVALPDLQETLRYIAEVLEEMERETFFTLKLVKNRLIKRRAERGG